MNSYRLLGPTKVHLEQELYQLGAMLLLTLSTLQGLPQQDDYYWGLMQWGDLKYLLLVGFWLGRNILVRWICTSDQSTHKSPSLKGVIAHWLCSLFAGGGQYFNRPHPETVAKQLGTHHADDGRNEIVTLKDLLFPSILYTWHAIKVRIVFPFLQAKDVFVSKLPPKLRPNLLLSAKKVDNKVDYSSKKGNDRSASNKLRLSRLYTQFRKRWGRYVPPAQILPISMFVILIYWYFQPGPPRENDTHALTMHTSATNMRMLSLHSLPFGGYQKKEKPTWVLTLILMSIIGTSANILVFGRVFLPIGDLVEGGGNVLKSIRNEFKPVQQHPTGHHHGSGKSKSKNQKEIPEPVSWPESYASVAHENRFRLLSKSTSIRIIENLVVCALFPRTQMICRFTGHCREGMSWSQLTKVLYPAGIVSALRADGEPESQFVFVDTERGAMIATILSIILIILTSLLTQGATLNRAYLSTLGYLAGGWTIVSQSHPATRGKPKPLPWDPRKEYKRGDLICQQFPGIGAQKFYMATTNQPEGKPFDLSLRVVHDAFRNELCHPDDSDLIKFLVRMQLNMIVGLIIMIVCYHVVGMDCGSLRWILLANLAAAYGTIRSTRTRGLSELETLAREISGPSSEDSSSEQSSVLDESNNEELSGGED